MPPPPTRGSILNIDPYLEEQERQREERLTRILQMERELALLRAREGDVLSSKPPPNHLPSQSTDHDMFLRRSPGPSHSSSLGPPSHHHQPGYSRENRDNGVYSGDHGGSDRNRNYYTSRSSPPPREYATRGYSGSSTSGSNAANTYREPVSYPTQYGSNNNSGFGSGSGRYSTTRSSAPSVGYGGTASATKTKSNVPPGWPSNDSKPVNRAPFSLGGPWS